jgi:hypothetical protein
MLQSLWKMMEDHQKLKIELLCDSLNLLLSIYPEELESES